MAEEKLSKEFQLPYMGWKQPSRLLVDFENFGLKPNRLTLFARKTDWEQHTATWSLCEQLNRTAYEVFC
jgi:hypothetical protein